jgi:hypothetical protein
MDPPPIPDGQNGWWKVTHFVGSVSDLRHSAYPAVPPSILGAPKCDNFWKPFGYGSSTCS